MKVRVVQRGFEGFTGILAGERFADGVSEADVDEIIFKRIGAAMKVEWIKEAKDESTVVQKEVAKVEPEIEETVDDEVIEEEAKYTVEKLSEIADMGGIGELRKIATPMGVKGKSIESLIDGILNVQKGNK
jgi:hypothetical protein